MLTQATSDVRHTELLDKCEGCKQCEAAKLAAKKH